MAWTVAFALLGALIFSMLVAPALASLLFRSGVKEWKNPVMGYLTARYRNAVTWTIHHRSLTVGAAVVLFAFAMFLAFGGVIGSEFLPHLDEGAIWVRGTLAPSTGPTESARVAERAREVLCSFPEVPQVVNQIGRPDDGTDTTGFFDMEFFVDLLPKEKWRPVFHQNKDLLIAAMDRELEKIPGVFWGFSQPISDNLEEAVSGVKGALAVKIYGDDLKTLEAKGDEIVGVMRGIRGVEDLGLFRVIGQPNLNFEVDRDQAARFGINVSDVQDAIQTAVGGNALSQVLIGEQRYDLVLRYLPQYRDTREAIEKIRLLSPTGERVSLAQLTKISVTDGGSEIYREANSRYVAIKFSVRGRDLGSTVEEAIRKVNATVKLPAGYTIDWAGEYESQKRSQRRLTDRPAGHDRGDLRHPVHHVHVSQMGAPDSDERGDGSFGRPLGLACHAYKPQRLLGRWLSSHFSACRYKPASSWLSTSINFEPEATRLNSPQWKEPCSDFGPL